MAAPGARLHLHLLVGSPVFAGPRRYSALVVFDRHGRRVPTAATCRLPHPDCQWFIPGNSLSLLSFEAIQPTAMICHERRYPEPVGLPVMAGAQIVFHPDARMDALAVSRPKRRGRDGIPVRAFENAVYCGFASSVGPHDGGMWSTGDSKITAPDGSILKLADNRHEAALVADLEQTDPGLATLPPLG